jgi:hypothetical protein
VDGAGEEAAHQKEETVTILDGWAILAQAESEWSKR